MARQLIYTSAEHGLAAGRSGFCTVARPVDIRERLASELERLSGFDRPPAGQPLPVIHAHRILTIGSDRYHILSCIQDAGPDYSGRTNHIAHHLICEEHELTTAASPALVLLRFPWKKRWTEPSRYFNKADEVVLSSFCEPAPTGGGWQQLTGNPAHVLLLLEPRAEQGCYIAYAAGREELLLTAFDESLEKTPEKKWRISFTTLLQATDNLRDFSWRGCYAGGAIYRKTQTSGDLVFDLTNPSSLHLAPASTEPPCRISGFGHAQDERNVAVGGARQNRPTQIKVQKTNRDELSNEEKPNHPGSRRILIGIILGGGLVVALLLGVAIWQMQNKTDPSAPHISSLTTPPALPPKPSAPPAIGTAPTNLLEQVALSVPPSTISKPPANQPPAITTKVTPSPLTQKPVQSELDLLLDVPIYILLFDLNDSDVDVSYILSTYTNTLTNTIYWETSSTFTGFPHTIDGTKGDWWKDEGASYYRKATTTLLTLNKDQLKVSVEKHIIVNCDQHFILILVNKRLLSDNKLWPLPVIKLSRRYLEERNAHNSVRVTAVRVTGELRESLKKIKTDSQSAAFQLVSSNVQQRVEGNLDLNLAAPQQEQKNIISNLTQKISGAEDECLKDEKKKAADLTKAIQNNYSSKLSNWVSRVKSDLEKISAGKSKPQSTNSVSINIPSFSPLETNNAAAIWPAYIDYLKGLISSLDEELPSKPSLVKLIESAQTEPEKLSGVIAEYEKVIAEYEKSEGIPKGNPTKKAEKLIAFKTDWQDIFVPLSLMGIKESQKPRTEKDETASLKTSLAKANAVLEQLPKELAKVRSITIQIKVGGAWRPFIEFEESP